MAITGGNFKDGIYAGFTLTPTKDGEPEYEEGGFTYEREQSPNGDGYVTGEAIPGHIQIEVAMTLSEYNEFIQNRDGTDKSGTFTAPNGDVVTLVGNIDGDTGLSGGKATFKFAGNVRIQ